MTALFAAWTFLAFPVEAFAASSPHHGIMLGSALGFYDLVRRHWPTEKPASLFRDIYVGLHQTITLLGKVDRFMDRILGQNVRKAP